MTITSVAGETTREYTPIFKNSIEEIDKRIISYSDGSSLVVLSGVSRAAQDVLTHDFFRERFFQQHPCLERFFQQDPCLEGFQNKILITLCKNHSSNCWKIVCDVFSRIPPPPKSFCFHDIP